MKAFLLLFSVTLFISKGIVAQQAPDTSKPSLISFSVLKGNDMFDYPIYKGDKLVYRVNAGGSEYDFIVTLNDYDYEKGIDFDYEMTAPANKKGHVKISAEAFQSSKKYNNYFRGGELDLTNASTVWMCYDNFMDMPKKKTTMTFDNGNAETFYRLEKDEIQPAIKFKGEDVKLDGFIISNKETGGGTKTLWIHNISANPLILKMDLGWTIELKEIR